MKFGKKTLFSLLLGLEIFVNILELIHVNFLGTTTLLAFFTSIVLPGLLISLILKIRKISFWENLVLIVGLSIAFLEFGGLLLNILLPLLGIKNPLAFQNIVIGFDVYILLLFILAWIRTKQLVFRIQLPRLSKIEKLYYALPVFFPILSTLGAIVLNNGGSNSLTLILLGSIASYGLLLVLFRDKISVDLYPFALFFIGLASLFTTSLRSWYITGHDIETEYYVFKLTNTHHIWNMAFYQDAYNACLSITILPTILTNLLSIQDMYVYKVIFQILFATSPVLVFFILRNYTTPIFAFLSAFLFMSFPTFFNDMPMLNRQEIGFIFFGLALYVMLEPVQLQQPYTKFGGFSLSLPLHFPQVSLRDKIPSGIKEVVLRLNEHKGVVQLASISNRVLTNKVHCTNCDAVLPSSAKFCGVCGVKLDKSIKVWSMRKILFIIFALSVIVSHYSTNFVLLALVVFLYISMLIISLPFVKKTLALLTSKSRIKPQITFPKKAFLSLPLVLLLISITYVWNDLYTHSSNHTGTVVEEVINGLFVQSNDKSSDLSLSIFASNKADPQQQLNDYIQSLEQTQGSNPSTNSNQLYSTSITDKYPTHLIPQDQLAPTPLGSFLTSLHIPVFNIQAESRVLAAYSLQVFVFIGLLAAFFLKREKAFDLQYLLLCVGAFFLLALITVLPALSLEYGVLRMFQQFLFIFSLPIVLGFSSILFFAKEQKIILFTGIVVIVFFLNLTGFIAHLTGDYYPQMTLDNAGLYYDAYYVDKSEVFAIVWLSEHDANNEPVQAAAATGKQLLAYGNITPVNDILPPVIQKNAYVFIKVSTSTQVTFDKSTLIFKSSKSFLDDNKNLIYSNGEYDVYK